MKTIAFAVFACLLINGCALMEVKKTYLKEGIPEPPKKQQESFESAEAAKAGMTLLAQLSEKGFYEGIKPKSKDADMVKDLAWRGMAMTGVLYNSGAMDSPDALQKYFDETEKKYDKMLEEQRQIQYKLEKDVADFQDKLLKSNRLVEDERAKRKEELSGWQVSFFWLKAVIYGILGVILLVIIGLGIGQVYTGLPLLTGTIKTLIPWAKGGVGLLAKGIKQTAVAIENTKEKIDEKIEEYKQANELKRAEALQEARDLLKAELSAKHDEDFKDYLVNKIGVNKPKEEVV